MIIADTGFWLALANANDRHHQRAKSFLADLAEPLVTTWPVMTETCYLLLDRLGGHSQRAYLRSFAAGAFDVFELTRESAPRMAELMERYAELPMDLADASLVILAEDLLDGRIVSTDRRDFGAYRWKEREPFVNLLFES
jgi:predicted nucleic acid-binding protein